MSIRNFHYIGPYLKVKSEWVQQPDGTKPKLKTRMNMNLSDKDDEMLYDRFVRPPYVPDDGGDLPMDRKAHLFFFPTKKTTVNGRKFTLTGDDFIRQDIRTVDCAKEIEWFEKTFKKELEIIRTAAGPENVTVEWDLITYAE